MTTSSQSVNIASEGMQTIKAVPTKQGVLLASRAHPELSIPDTYAPIQASRAKNI